MFSAVPGEQEGCQQYPSGVLLLPSPKAGPTFHSNEETFHSTQFPEAPYKGSETRNIAELKQLILC